MNHKVSTLIYLLMLVNINFVVNAEDGQQILPNWQAPEEYAARINPIQSFKESINSGRKLFLQSCTSCHGKNADGTGIAADMLYPKPTNLRDISGKRSDGDIAYKIKYGRGPMPEWNSELNDTQIWHLVNYIQSLINDQTGINK